MIGAQLPRCCDYPLHARHLAFRGFISRASLWIGSQSDRLRLPETVPQLLGDEWHDGMLQPQESPENAQQVAPIVSQSRIRSETQLLYFQIPVAKIMPGKLP